MRTFNHLVMTKETTLTTIDRVLSYFFPPANSGEHREVNAGPIPTEAPPAGRFDTSGAAFEGPADGTDRPLEMVNLARGGCLYL